MIGQTLGNYRIIEQVGLGGMATVYKAFDPDTERYVAVKTLPQGFAHDPDFRERFRREAKAIARLEHIHILPVFTYGEQDGVAYLVMRYLPSGTLADRIRAGEMPYSEISRLLGQLAGALDYAHSQGVIHRDIKPSNVLVDDRENLYLTDFGIAKMMQGSTIDLTGENILGTPQYMSPEQCRGDKEITPASDIYSLGIVLYEMVTGRTPFNAETPLAVIYKQLSDPLPLPSSWRADLPAAAEAVILKALAKEAPSRYQTCVALADAFARAIATGLPAASAAERTHLVLNDAPLTPRMMLDSHPTTQDVPAAPPAAVDAAPPLEKPKRTPQPARLGRRALITVIAGAAVVASIALALFGADRAVVGAPPITADNVGALSQQAALPLRDAPRAYAASPDGATLAVARRLIALWTGGDVPSAEFGSLLDEITALAYNPDGSLLVSGGMDGTVSLWEVASQQEIGHLDIGAPVADVSFSADGAQLAVATDTALLSIWDMETRSRLMEMSLKNMPNDIAFAPDGDWIALVDQEGLWYAVADGSRIEPAALLGGMRQVVFSPAQAQLAVSYEEGKIDLFDTSSAPYMMIITTTLTGHTTPPTALAFSADGSLLLSSGSSEVRVWSTLSGGQRAVLEDVAAGELVGMAISRDGATMGVVSEAEVTLWRAAGE